MVEPTAQVECPKCKATRDDLRLVYLMEAYDKITSDSPGELIARTGHVADPPGGTTASLLCQKCNTRWPLPKGITVVAVNGDKRTTIFGPDGRSR